MSMQNDRLSNDRRRPGFALFGSAACIGELPLSGQNSHLIRSPRSARESSAGGMFRLSALAVLRLMTSSKFRRLLDRKVRRLCDFEDLQFPWPSTTPGCEPAALPLTVPRYWASSSIWSAGIGAP